MLWSPRSHVVHSTLPLHAGNVPCVGLIDSQRDGEAWEVIAPVRLRGLRLFSVLPIAEIASHPVAPALSGCLAVVVLRIMQKSCLRSREQK